MNGPGRLAVLLRLTPFDTSTEAGRSRERYRRAALGSLTALAARGVGAFVTVLAVPLTLHYLGREQYAIWATLLSAVAVLASADLGVGSALITMIARALGRGDRDSARRYTSSACVILICVSLALGALVFFVYPLVSWSTLFNVSTEPASAEVGPAVLVVATLVLIGVPLGLVQRVQTGMQETFAAGLWLTAGSVAALAGMLTAIALGGSLTTLLVGFLGAPLLVLALNWIAVFRVSAAWLTPRISFVDREAAGAVLRTGLMFLALQGAIAVMLLSDNLIALRVLGPGSVAELSVAQRLFLLIPLAAWLANATLWPAYGDAISRAEWSWIRTTVNRSIRVSVGLSTWISVVLVLLAKPVFSSWVGPELVPSISLLVALALFAVLLSWGNAATALLNAAGVVRLQVATALLMAGVGIPIKLGLVMLIGVAGVAWGDALSYFVFTFLPLSWYLRRSLRLAPRSNEIEGRR